MFLHLRTTVPILRCGCAWSLVSTRPKARQNLDHRRPSESPSPGRPCLHRSRQTLRAHRRRTHTHFAPRRLRNPLPPLLSPIGISSVFHASACPVRGFSTHPQRELTAAHSSSRSTSPPSTRKIEEGVSEPTTSRGRTGTRIALIFGNSHCDPLTQTLSSDLPVSSIISNCSPTCQCLVCLPAKQIIMAAVARSRSRSRGNINPSVPISDTPYASDPSELLLSSIHPPGQPLPDHANEHTRTRLPSISLRTRAETISSVSSTSSSPVRRKPLPATASPLATRFSSGEHLTGRLKLPDQPFVRPYSVDSPTLHEFPPTSSVPYNPAVDTEQSLWRPDVHQDALTSEFFSDPVSPHRATFSQQTASHPSSPNLIVPLQTRSTATPLSKHARLTSESTLTTASESITPWFSDTSSTTYSNSTMSIFSPKPTPPHNLNGPHVASRSYSNESNDSNTTIQKSQPKSPGASKLGSFFGWGGNSPTSSTTTFSEKSFSPIPSPGPSENTLISADASRTASSKNIPSAIDVPKANAEAGSYFGSAYLQLPLATPTTPVQVEEMEKELKDISSELASSIRREMDLEDLVERLQAEAQNPPSSAGKRTSDYFSDSGTSSVKYGGEPDSRQDELDRAIRKTEQEKAQIRLELTGKVQDERTRRKHLEAQIRNLEEKASQVDLASINSMDANGRVRDLEATCEDLRRRLAEEKQVKDNFEDLLTALKSELLTSHNERDNLRDEIVPQLRARVEGLEAQAAEHEQLAYEQSKMQQELQTLKNENQTLINAQRLQMEMQRQMKKFNTIVEESAAPTPTRSSIGLMRSNSVAQSNVSRAKSGSLSRSASVKTAESRDALAERVKDVEAQRDALHRALKSLLERQEYQNRENQKRIRQLEMERDRALTNSPKRLSYDKEVANLRDEINTLRRRADEAIEQKWQ
ncbi:uncharacterized protein LY89DRAFT_442835 [Mollisia scopiformis]|uniref:Uncharacterized protein n=1 Tax=Mollisia scopiformis TaxID=149040 RepID=A0A194XJT0_MOLSC|nr:uncharacterized protein LY89DRAFT_442835 [Mollisia scopiformis]KUJ20413.1 hypothetical protein LY89DRAFT_442835 [Mollisia scopiformis]